MSNIKLFESKKIRATWHEAEQKWYFSVADVVRALTYSNDVKQSIKRMRQRDPELNANWGTICTLVEMTAADGKRRQIQCANVEGFFRIIQSIPSSKAEPFKRRLAKVGYERLEESENPKLAAQRMRGIYRTKGCSEAWIEKRMRGIAVHDELTGEWEKRGVRENREFALLTAEISKATLGLTPSEYKAHKNLTYPGDNLRDHMTDLELIFTNLGEASTTEIARNKNAQASMKTSKFRKKAGKLPAMQEKHWKRSLAEK